MVPERKFSLVKPLLAGLALLALAACGETPALPIEAQIGPDPVLPEPDPSLIPIVNIAPAVGWSEGETPTAAPELTVNAFARGFNHPRWLYVLPNGDMLVAETNAPPRPEHGGGIRGWAMGKVMENAGAATPSANRITLLRDSDGDGRAETRTTFLENLNSPFGMELASDDFYVANTDAIVRFPYQSGETTITAPGEVIAELPAGPAS